MALQHLPLRSAMTILSSGISMLLFSVLSAVVLDFRGISGNIPISITKFSVNSWKNETGYVHSSSELYTVDKVKDPVGVIVEVFSGECNSIINRATHAVKHTTTEPRTRLYVEATEENSEERNNEKVLGRRRNDESDEDYEGKNEDESEEEDEDQNEDESEEELQDQNEDEFNLEDEHKDEGWEDQEEGDERAKREVPEKREESKVQASLCSSAAPTADEQLSGYQNVGGCGYYNILGDQMDWTAGVKACQENGTRMLLVESQEEIEALSKWAGKIVWVGVHRKNSLAPWINVLGKEMNPADFEWLPGSSSSEERHCMALDLSKSLSNEPCDSSFWVICEL